jgi:hypothetical protein
MARREEEKERRRKERLAAEQSAAGSAARRRRVQIVLGGLAAFLLLGGVGFALLRGDEKDGPPPPDSVLPAKQTSHLPTAIQNADGCRLVEARDEGNDHLPDKDATFDGYKTNPPTSGTHRPPPAAPDGFYEPGASPDKEDWVHTLEHGRIIFQYAPGTPQQRIDQLAELMDEEFGGRPAGFKTAVMENNTKMPFAVAAVSWSRYVGCEEFTNETFDVLRAFREKYVEMAPEGEFPWPAS